MNIEKRKLHVVLTAKTKHADFKCFLCKKIFISKLHLSSHFYRRHSQHLQDEISKKMVPLSIHQDTSHGKMSAPRVKEASRRMEKVLQDLNLEEMKMNVNENRWFSTPRANIEQHLNVTGLSPINYNSDEERQRNEYLYGRNCHQIKDTPLSTVTNFKFLAGNAKRPIHYETGEVILDSNKNLDSILKTIYSKYTFVKRTHRGINRVSNNGGNMIVSLDGSNKNKFTNCDGMVENLFAESYFCADNSNSSATHPLTNSDAYDRRIRFAEMSTQTEESSVLNADFQKSRLTNSYCENGIMPNNSLPTGNIDTNLDGLESCRIFSNCNAVGTFNNDVIEQLEKEFKESFEARKNLLTENDYPNNEEDRPVAKVDNETSCRSPVTVLSEEASEASNISLSNHVSAQIVTTEQDSVKESEPNKLSEEMYNEKRMKIDTKLATNLRKLGVDPTWGGITNRVYEKTISILEVRRQNIAKENSDFLPMRTMLNNTVDQMLEANNEV